METIQDLFPWIDPELLNPVVSAAIVLIAFVGALAFLKVVLPLILRFTNFTPTDLGTRLVESIRKPVTFGILATGRVSGVDRSAGPHTVPAGSCRHRGPGPRYRAGDIFGRRVVLQRR